MVPYTSPLSCTLDYLTIKQSFLLSNHCPVNLLGSDQMCIFGIVLASHPDDFQVSKMPVALQFLKYHPAALLYIFEWSLLPSSVGSITSHLISFVHADSTQAGRFMLGHSICVLHFGLYG